MEKEFLSDQVVNILQVGLSGFAFLVILMSYFLLKAEQKRKGDPRPTFLKSTNRFMWLTLVFVLIVGGFGLARLLVNPANNMVASEDCREDLKKMRLLSKSPGQDKASLVQLIETLSEGCLAEEDKR